MKAFIISAQRTPIGSFNSVFRSVPAPFLGAEAIKGALKTAAIKPDQVDECIMGQVLTAGSGQAPARQAALGAGLPPSTSCLTINKVCGSGLKAVMLAADAIELDHSQVVVAGGQENMSQAPHILMNARSEHPIGHIADSMIQDVYTALFQRLGSQMSLLDSMIHDGLWDPYNDFHMGNAGEICAQKYNFTREDQDDFAEKSYKKAQKAQADNIFDSEIIPVEGLTKEGDPTQVTADEEPPRAKFDKMRTLRPAFDKEGTITAANASKLNDGACALVIASPGAVKKNNLKPLAKIVAHATFAQEPKWFTTAPVGAIKKVLEKTGLSVNDIDLWEINEAFSNVTMAALKELQIDADKVNVHGGAVALGHPIGASGARILTTLCHALKKHNKKHGLASLCIGGGEAVAVIVECVDEN